MGKHITHVVGLGVIFVGDRVAQYFVAKIVVV
jgi:hypothetical protein